MPNKPNNYSEEELLQLLQHNSAMAVDILFRTHYTSLCRSIYRIIPDTNLVEDLVQDVFFELWKKRENIVIKTSIGAYLRRAARNKALNYIRDQKMKFEDDDKIVEMDSGAISSIQQLEMAELEQRVETAIGQLPERCRLVFSLSRFEEMTYQEIADALSISIKTVENQISKALKLLRKALIE